MWNGLKRSGPYKVPSLKPILQPNYEKRWIQILLRFADAPNALVSQYKEHLRITSSINSPSATNFNIDACQVATSTWFSATPQTALKC